MLILDLLLSEIVKAKKKFRNYQHRLLNKILKNQTSCDLTSSSKDLLQEFEFQIMNLDVIQI